MKDAWGDAPAFEQSLAQPLAQREELTLQLTRQEPVLLNQDLSESRYRERSLDQNHTATRKVDAVGTPRPTTTNLHQLKDP